MSVSTVYDDVVVGVFERDSGDEAVVAGGETVSTKKPLSADGSPAAHGAVRQRACCVEDEGDALQDAKRARLGGIQGEEKLTELRRQIEYYFSDANLSQDDFFHGKIAADPEGWLDSSWLLGCPRVVSLGVDDDATIEKALEGSQLEVRRMRAAAAEDADGANEAVAGSERSRPPLQVRRPEGRELPSLLKAGWLQEKIAARRRAAAEAEVASEQPGGGGEAGGEEEKQGLAAAAGPEASVAIAAGERVRMKSGEHAGQVGQVLALDGDEATLALQEGDIVTVALGELEPAAAS